MAEVLSWAANSGDAPLPVPKRPPIRPAGVQPMGVLTSLLIAATLLQAATVGWGAWMFEQMRRGEAAAGGLSSNDLPSERRVDEATHRDLIVSNEDAVLEMQLRASIERERLKGIFFGTAALIHGLEVIAFVFWQIQAHSNLTALGSLGTRYGSGTSVVWWFVPIAVLWKPLGVLQEIWKGSDPSVAAGDETGWRLKRPSFLATIWWSLLVAAKFLYWFSAFMYLGDLFTIVTPVEMWVIALAITFSADGLQVVMVRRIALRQAALERKRLAAVAKAEGAGQPVVEIEALLSRAKPKADAVSIGGAFDPQPAVDETASSPESDAPNAVNDAAAATADHGTAETPVRKSPDMEPPAGASAGDTNAGDDVGEPDGADGSNDTVAESKP